MTKVDPPAVGDPQRGPMAWDPPYKAWLNTSGARLTSSSTQATTERQSMAPRSRVAVLMVRPSPLVESALPLDRWEELLVEDPSGFNVIT